MIDTLGDMIIVGILAASAAIMVLAVIAFIHDRKTAWKFVHIGRFLVGFYWIAFYGMLLFDIDFNSRLMIRSPILITISVMLAALITGRRVPHEYR